MAEAVTSFNLNAFGIAAFTLAIGVAWPKRFHRFLPPPLAAFVFGMLFSILWLKGTPVIGQVPTGLPQIHLPVFSINVPLRAMQPALTMALLGSINSLLTSLVADSITRTRHNPNQELIGQGLGNVAAGLMWGVPGAGSTVGTVVNLRAGGQTQVSGVLRAAILLALVLGLGKYVEIIPLSVLAGILMKVGWDIIDWRFLGRIHHV